MAGQAHIFRPAMAANTSPNQGIKQLSAPPLAGCIARARLPPHTPNTTHMKIAYLTNCFGTQSHTFMRREIRALRRLQVPLTLYGINKDRQNAAADAQDLMQETTYLYPLSAPVILKANAHYFRRSPFRYLRGLWRAFTGPEFSVSRRAKMAFHYFAAAPFARHMTQQGVTHIHAQFLNVSASVAMFAAEHSGLPFSVTVHSAGSFKAPDTLGLQQKLEAAQFLIMISHFNVAYYDAVAPCREKSHVIRCGMNLLDFTFEIPERLKSRATEAPGSHKTKLLGVARFVAKKGFRYLIEAAALLKQQSVSFELTLIGSGPLDSELRTLVKQLDLQQEVIFAGQKSTAEVRAAMATSDIVVVPSITTDSGDMEGLPVVIMEAMASGAAVVASAHSGIPEIVIPDQTGELTEERNPASIAAAITKLIEQPSVDTLLRARKLIEDNFNIEVVARQRLELFQHYQQAQ